MIADEVGQLICIAVRIDIVIVLGEEIAQVIGIVALRRKSGGVALQTKVEHRRQRQIGCKLAQEGRIAVKHFAKHAELGFALRLSIRENFRGEGLPQLIVDVFHRIDPETVDIICVDRVFEDVDKAVDDVRMLGEEVI